MRKYFHHYKNLSMATIEKFEEILSWQEARKLNQKIGRMIDSGRFEKNFRLIAQVDGSAGSIMDNIAEGFERSGNREFIQFLYIAKGSCGEFRSQLYKALDRNYITQEEFDDFAKKTKKVSSLIQKLINYLHETDMRGTKYKT